MKKVRFLQDFRGLITDETFYRAGEEVELSDQAAAEAITNGWAEDASEESPDPSKNDGETSANTDPGSAGAKTGSKKK